MYRFYKTKLSGAPLEILAHAGGLLAALTDILAVFRGRILKDSMGKAPFRISFESKRASKMMKTLNFKTVVGTLGHKIEVIQNRTSPNRTHFRIKSYI